MSIEAGLPPPRTDASNAGRAPNWLRGSAVVCTGPLPGCLQVNLSLFSLSLPCTVSDRHGSADTYSDLALRRVPLDGLRASLCYTSAQPCGLASLSKLYALDFPSRFSAAYNVHVVGFQHSFTRAGSSLALCAGLCCSKATSKLVRAVTRYSDSMSG